jgi:Fe-S oxidoreductase
MEGYLRNFKNCRQKDIPFCASACPFHLDVFDFIEKMRRGAFKGAFKAYRNAVGFPLVASGLCDAPCKEVCPGRDSAGAVELGLLEKACVALTEDRKPTDYNLPAKRKRAAVVGAGISGLACALRLCMKKYAVEIFEASDRIGGHLWEIMDPGVFLPDIEEQFMYETYTLRLNTAVQIADDLSGGEFDAVYVATGEGGADFGLLDAAGDAGDRYCARFGRAGWFAGGGLIGDRPVFALARGLFMGTIIDNFLKTGKLLYSDMAQPTRTCTDPLSAVFADPVMPADRRAYSAEEAQREAARCKECRCDFCRNYCDLTTYFNKWPLRIRDEIMATTLPGSAEVKATPAKRLLSTCNQCGLCKETCPEDIDLGGLILAGRRSMHRQRKAPWVFHDFWLRDMDFANSDEAALARPAAGADMMTGADSAAGIGIKPAADPEAGAASLYAFFPGCQLGAGDPESVESAYAYLVSKRPDTGLLLRCCGAPAEWSGDEEKHREEVETIRAQWEALGRPTLILACPACMKKFKQYMRDIPVISLYEVLADWGVDPPRAEDPAVCAVFDACAARHEKGMKAAVRRLARQAGYRLTPLPRNDANARCCGYGGQPGVANPGYADFVARERIGESDAPYITYCVNCRDIFAKAGKEAVHILELVFGRGERTPPRFATVGERRENRIRLKRTLLKRFWNEDRGAPEGSPRIKLTIPPALAQKLDQERILYDDLVEVIAFCERTGRRIMLPERNAYSGYREVGRMTYWAEYRKGNEEGAYELVNAYAHRMKIELEEVWNGRRTEADL